MGSTITLGGPIVLMESTVPLADAADNAYMADVIGNMRLSNFWVMIPLIAPKMKGRRQRPHAVAGLDDAYLPARSLSRMARNSSPSTQLGQSVVFASARPTS